ncbi:MAG: dienelactone hydrolase family protein [Acidimicrobiia bacterium]
MGEMIEFATIGGPVPAYLATPETGSSTVPLLVLQEYWGLVDHIKDVCDRFAAEGFVAMAPDLYRGVTTTEPDEAGKLMMALNILQAGNDLNSAVDDLRRRTGRTKVGVTGFCMGGGLAWTIAYLRPDAVGALVPWYGVIPWERALPRWHMIDCPVLGHYAENDTSFGPDQVAELQQKLDDLGKRATLKVHPGVDHAFFNDSRPEVYDEATATACFAETVAFLRGVLR